MHVGDKHMSIWLMPQWATQDEEYTIQMIIFMYEWLYYLVYVGDVEESLGMSAHVKIGAEVHVPNCNTTPN